MTTTNDTTSETQKPVKSGSNASEGNALVNRWAKFVFARIRQQALNTLHISDYERIVNSPSEWATLRGKMDTFFKDSLEMFPYDTSAKDEAKTGSLFARLWNFITPIRKPLRYYDIQSRIIEMRFPGGFGFEPGDGDLRQMISALRIVFKVNISQFILLKRFLQILFMVLVFFGVDFLYNSFNAFQYMLQVQSSNIISRLGLEFNGMDSKQVSITLFYLLTTIVLLLASVFLFRLSNRIIFDYYESSQGATCLFVGREASQRTKNLSNLFEEIMPRIDKDRVELANKDMTREWPMRAHHWMTLGYWVANRLEYVERFVQIELWRIRRIHYFWNLRGFALNLGVMVLALVMLLGHFFFMRPDFLPSTSMVATAIWTVLHIVFGIYAGFIWVTSFSNWNTSLDLIENTLRVESWNRFSSINLHERIAHQVFSDKQNQLNLEALMSGKRT